MLTVELKVNGHQIALAAVQNTSPAGHGPEANSYSVSVTTGSNPYGAPSEACGHQLEITDHDRALSPWALVAKIAAQIAERENGLR